MFFLFCFVLFVFCIFPHKKANSHKEFTQIAHFEFDGIVLLAVENRQTFQFFLLQLNCKTKFYCCLLRRIVSIVSLCFVIFLRLINKRNTVTFKRSTTCLLCMLQSVALSLHVSPSPSNAKNTAASVQNTKCTRMKENTTHKRTAERTKKKQYIRQFQYGVCVVMTFFDPIKRMFVGQYAIQIPFRFAFLHSPAPIANT